MAPRTAREQRRELQAHISSFSRPLNRNFGRLPTQGDLNQVHVCPPPRRLLFCPLPASLSALPRAPRWSPSLQSAHKCLQTPAPLLRPSPSCALRSLLWSRAGIPQLSVTATGTILGVPGSHGGSEPLTSALAMQNQPQAVRTQICVCSDGTLLTQTGSQLDFAADPIVCQALV